MNKYLFTCLLHLYPLFSVRAQSGTHDFPQIYPHEVYWAESETTRKVHDFG